MIYLVSQQKNLFSDIKNISVEESLEILNKIVLISVDSETTGLDCHSNYLILLQLGNKFDQVLIDCTTIDINNYRELLENKSLIFQNAKFDLKFLYKHSIIPKGELWDTMLAEKVLYNGLDPLVNLAHLIDKYCGEVVDKSIREFIPDKFKRQGLTYDILIYAAKDIVFLDEIRTHQVTDAIKKNVLNAIRLENSFVKALAYTEFCGLYLNKEKWINKYTNAKKDLREITDKLNNYVIQNNLSKYIDKQLNLFSTDKKVLINWSSQKQVIPLFKDIGIDTRSETTKSGESIAEPILIKQKERFEIIPLYLQYQTIRKDFSTYGESFLQHINPITGRIHTDFDQIMVTSRLSSNNPNLQNLPRDERTRSCFTNQKDDTILVVADFSGQEDILFVNRSKEQKMIEFYQSEFSDGHSYVAKLCFVEELKNIPLQDVKKARPDLRYKAKTAKFAIHYSGIGKTIAKNLNISIEEGNRIYNSYMKAFPDIAKYLKDRMSKAKKEGVIITSTLTNRKVWCNNFKSIIENDDYIKLYEFAKLACNYPIQTEGAEITKIATYQLFKWIVENGLFKKVLICNLIHDEIMCECHVDIAITVSNKLKECMEKAGEYYCDIVPLKAVPEITKFWMH